MSCPDFSQIRVTGARDPTSRYRIRSGMKFAVEGRIQIRCQRRGEAMPGPPSKEQTSCLPGNAGACALRLQLLLLKFVGCRRGMVSPAGTALGHKLLRTADWQ